MVDRRVTDGRRIAELLSSELHGREDGALAAVAVTDAVADVEPTADGALAYRVTVDGDTLATAHVHPDRAHLAFRAAVETAVDAAGAAGLRARPKAVDPPGTLVFVPDGAAVKDAVDVVAAVAGAARDG